MFCKNCGKLLQGDEKFCSQCGTKVEIEKPKTSFDEPLFFVKERESEKKKEKPVIHLEEFNWNLDGYPTTPKKTEDVDFDWASVLEERKKPAEEKSVESETVSKKAAAEEIEEAVTKVTVEELLADLPEETVEKEASTSPAVHEKEVPLAEEEKEPEKKQKVSKEIQSLEELFKEIDETPIEEPTKLIDKAQMKAESVDRFYIFNKKQAEFQALLDQEYERIQNSLLEKREETGDGEQNRFNLLWKPARKAVPMEEEPKVFVEEPTAAAKTEVEADVKKVSSHTIVMKPEKMAAQKERTEAMKEELPPVKDSSTEMIAVLWAKPPTGIVVVADRTELQEEPVKTEAEMPANEPPVKPEPAKETPASIEGKEKPVAKKTEEKPVEKKAEEKSAEKKTEEKPIAKPAVKKETADTKTAETSEKAEPTKTEPKAETKPEEGSEENASEKEEITFADIFREDEDDEEAERKGSKILKVLAIILGILVILELGILGIQKLAPDSRAAKFITETTNTILEKIKGEESREDPAETEGSSEIEQVIVAQMGKNENIVSVTQDKRLFFEEGKTYGFSDFENSFAFQNSPWYDLENGGSITFADEIIGTLIQYYSALSDKYNDVNNDILDFIDKNSAYYETADKIEGADDKGYVINYLEIGEIRTGSKGFYIIVRVTSVDKEHPGGAEEKQVVYMEPNAAKKEMKIIDVKTV